MRRLSAAAAYAVLVLIAHVTGVRAGNADSLVYSSLRAHFAAADSTSQALQTADALAEAGLFTEAAELLREHAPAGASVPTTALHAPGSQVQWRISTGIDYYHLEDVDTVAMTPEELRDYKRLTETPLSAWLRAKSVIKPAAPLVEEIVPEAYVSERKSRVETTARISSLNGFLRLEPSIKAEKWFRADASGDSPFAPAAAQPSDMGGALLQLTAGNVPNPRTSATWTAPLSVDWEHYRKDRTGYESFLEYRFMPSLEVRAQSLPLYGRFSAQAEYENYYRAGSDTLDVLRFSGRAEGHARTAEFSALLNGAWMGDRYANASGLEAIDRFEGGFRGECKAVKYLTGRFRLRGIHERERYGHVSGAAGFGIDGSELSIEPGVETGIGEHLRIGPELLWEQRWTDVNNGLFLWEARSAWEPGLRIGWSSAIIEASARGAFRAEDIGPGFESYTADNRSIRVGGDFSVTPVRSLSISLFADYQYRVYAPYGNRARVSENLAISGNISVGM
jgi:hypothetical protein